MEHYALTEIKRYAMEIAVLTEEGLSWFRFLTQDIAWRDGVIEYKRHEGLRGIKTYFFKPGGVYYQWFNPETNHYELSLVSPFQTALIFTEVMYRLYKLTI